MPSFLGMRGTGDWSGNERPQSWREGTLLYFPNGDMPLTAVTSKGRKEATTDPRFNWFEKGMATQCGVVTQAYTDAALTTAVLIGSTYPVGQTIYINVAEAVAGDFRVGHSALVADMQTHSHFVWGKVVAVDLNGASSYVAIKLRTAGTAGYLLVSATNTLYLENLGDINPEGGYIPDALSYDPTEYYNLTQIFRTPIDITRTQRKTKMRTGDVMKEAKREALMYHGIGIEAAAILGARTELVGLNGKKERTTQGIIPWLVANNSDNVVDYSNSTALSWLVGGEDWFDEKLEQLFRYGRTTKMALCGSGALLGISKLVKARSSFQLTAVTGAYGVTATKWVTPFGEVLLKHAPLLTKRIHNRNSIIMFEPENLVFRYIDDTHFKDSSEESQAGHAGFDGTKQEFLTEGGFEFHFAKTAMYMTSVGLEGTGA